VQFAPKLTSAGGNFDPTAWAKLFAQAGAKFVGLVAEHHDGYAMWNSTVNEWNFVKHGPKLDLVGLHAQAIRAQGLKFMVSLHRPTTCSGRIWPTRLILQRHFVTARSVTVDVRRPPPDDLKVCGQQKNARWPLPSA
jgi:alpha-L-fucosidase